MKTIYDYIDAMEQRPDMFAPDLSLRTFETLLHGYCACLSFHGLQEPCAGRPFHPRDFAKWLYETQGWSGGRGFAAAIEEHTASPDEALATFFQLVRRFRAS